MQRLWFTTWIAICLIVLLGVYYTATMRVAGNDAHYYLYGAETFRAGQGLLNWTGAPPEAVAVMGDDVYLITFPPLYPLLLSLFPTVWSGAQVINLIAFLTTVRLTWRLLATHVTSRVLRQGGLIAILLSPPFQSAFTIPLTESLFIALTLVWVECLALTKRSVVPLALVTLALVLQRYAGVVMLGLGCFYILQANKGFVGIRRAALYAFLPCSALALWFGRNYLLTGHLTGHSPAVGDYQTSAVPAMILYGGRWLAFAVPCILLALLGQRVVRRWKQCEVA